MTPRFQGLIWSLLLVGLYLLLTGKPLLTKTTPSNSPDFHMDPVRMFIRRRDRPPGTGGTRSADRSVVILVNPGEEEKALGRYRDRYTTALRDVGFKKPTFIAIEPEEYKEAQDVGTSDKDLSDYYHKWGRMGTAKPKPGIRGAPFPLGPVSYPIGDMLRPSHPAPPIARDFEKSFLDHQDDLL